MAALASLESWAAEANVGAMMVAMATAAVKRFCLSVVISYLLLLELLPSVASLTLLFREYRH